MSTHAERMREEQRTCTHMIPHREFLIAKPGGDPLSILDYIRRSSLQEDCSMGFPIEHITAFCCEFGEDQLFYFRDAVTHDELDTERTSHVDDSIGVAKENIRFIEMFLEDAFDASTDEIEVTALGSLLEDVNIMRPCLSRVATQLLADDVFRIVRMRVDEDAFDNDSFHRVFIFRTPHHLRGQRY